MYVKQLSIFIENRKGRLEDVTTVLSQNDINIVSLSLADTNEYGLLRMIVSDPDNAKKVLKENGFSATLTDVLAVKLSYRVGMLKDILNVLGDADVNIEYMYALATGQEFGSMIIKPSDVEAAAKALVAGDMGVCKAEEVYSIHGLL